MKEGKKKEELEFEEGAVVTKPGSLSEIKTGGWRSHIPTLDQEKCKRCGICWMYCPDAAIKKINKKQGVYNHSFVIDYNFCKGCGICAKECPFNAITMKEEEK